LSVDPSADTTAVRAIPETSEILSAMQKIGIFGGTFNPPHWGHLRIAEAAIAQKSLDQVLWMPTHPHYKAADILDFRHRQAMVERVINSKDARGEALYPKFALCPPEANQSSYAIDNLVALQSLYPHRQWFWFVGMDAFRSLPRWYRSVELVTRCGWLVAPRDSMVEAIDPFVQRGMAIEWELLKMPHVEISSSQIREYCHNSRSIRHLVPADVEAYIVEQDLYQPAF
jgi:nicotinate-nucleotide adenylyltransferase